MTMRLVLTAAVALTALAPLPASAAAPHPTCLVALVHESVGTTAQCSSGVQNTPYRAYRWLRVEVAIGAADATLSCTGFGSRSQRVYAGTPAMLAISANTSAVCVATLTAVTSGTKATGLNSFTPDLIDEAGA